jgi:hypothetical protein
MCVCVYMCVYVCICVYMCICIMYIYYVYVCIDADLLAGWLAVHTPVLLGDGARKYCGV